MLFYHITQTRAAIIHERVVLDAGVSCKIIIASVNRFMHWKVGFQSLCSITCFKNWIYQPTCQGNPIRFITFMVQIRYLSKRWVHQSPSPFKLDNKVNKNSIFSTKHVESLQKARCSFISHHPTYSYNHPYNPHQQSLPLLQPIFTSLNYLLTWLPHYPYNHH